MGCPENITKLTKEQLSENGRKGQKASTEAKKRKKAMKEELMMILALPVKKSIKNAANKMLTVDKAKALADFAGRNTTVQTQILLKLTQMAMSGNIKAMQLVMELSGERNQVDNSQEAQNAIAIDFFVKQKVQVDDMQSNQVLEDTENAGN